MTNSADRVRRVIRAQRDRTDVAARRDDVVRLAGLFKDLFASDDASDATVDETREQLFDAIDSLREACK